jgi:hypothetical protein
VHQDVVVLAIELPQVGLEVGPDLAHEFLAADQHLAGEHSTPVFRDKYQMCVEALYDMAAGADIGFAFRRGDMNQTI